MILYLPSFCRLCLEVPPATILHLISYLGSLFIRKHCPWWVLIRWAALNSIQHGLRPCLLPTVPLPMCILKLNLEEDSAHLIKKFWPTQTTKNTIFSFFWLFLTKGCEIPKPVIIYWRKCQITRFQNHFITWKFNILTKYSLLNWQSTSAIDP